MLNLRGSHLHLEKCVFSLLVKSDVGVLAGESHRESYISKILLADPWRMEWKERA